MNAMKRWIRPLSYLSAGLIAAAGFGIATGAGDKGDDHYRVTAYFEKAIGLFKNSDVMILGVPVGKITRVDPAGNSVRVDMEISDEYKVPADAFAQIVPISVIADRFVQLAPVYESGPTLEDGAVLDLDDTQIPAELDDVFRQLKKLLDAIEPGKPGEPGALGSLIVQLDETLRDRENDLRGTLINGAELTSTLAEAEDDISGLLINLDNLFSKLSTRSGAIGELNTNFALVMRALVESRSDLEGTLTNLANLTHEVADVVSDNRARLGEELRLAAKITEVVVKNRDSVEQSLQWLPVVGEGLKKAYHPEPIDAVDVRDNANAKLECEILDPLPPSPIKDALEEFCQDQTGAPSEPDVTTGATTFEAGKSPTCTLGVKKVRRQLKKLAKVGLPSDVTDDIVKPLRKRIRKLEKKCDVFADLLAKPGPLLEDLLPSVGESPELGDLTDVLEDLDLDGDDPLGPLTGSAAGTAPVPDHEPPGMFQRVGGWFSGFFGFLGVGR